MSKYGTFKEKDTKGLLESRKYVMKKIRTWNKDIRKIDNRLIELNEILLIKAYREAEYTLSITLHSRNVEAILHKAGESLPLPVIIRFVRNERVRNFEKKHLGSGKNE